MKYLLPVILLLTACNTNKPLNIDRQFEGTWKITEVVADSTKELDQNALLFLLLVGGDSTVFPATVYLKDGRLKMVAADKEEIFSGTYNVVKSSGHTAELEVMEDNPQTIHLLMKKEPREALFITTGDITYVCTR